ncbi:hypothetical protein PMAYCL1PPCAC_18316, partial [Pristionchus mayeri]
PPPPPPHSSAVPFSQREKVTNRHDDESLRKKEDGNVIKEGAFYTTRVFAEKGGAVSASSIREAVKGGIPVFPPSMMAEIAGSGGGAERLTRSEVTRTPNPTVKERLRDASLTPTLKGTFEYPTTILPQTRNNWNDFGTKPRIDTPKVWERCSGERQGRAASAGPPRVSRIEDSSNNEAQFIFRAHGSDEDVGYNYRMGRSVYPLPQMERMNPTMNREMEWRGRTPSIWSCNSSRVSTPVSIREDENGMRYRVRSASSRGRVGESARCWPPPTNAEGADIGKETFVDGDGVTTLCTRIVQKKNEERWRWLDENGRTIDEKKEFSLMGDTDEVRRGGPCRGSHYSQHFIIDRDGRTRVENTHRQYDRNFVVESVCRNY